MSNHYNKLPQFLATHTFPQNPQELIKKFVAEPTDKILHLYGQPSATVCVLLGQIKWLNVTDKGVARAQHVATGNIIEFH